MKIQEVSFEDVLPIWRDKLWQGRVSAIEPYSSMYFMGGYDHDHKCAFKYMPRIFLAGYVDGEIVAVNSLHLTGDKTARSRGLWVDPKFRGKGFGKEILQETIQKAKSIGAESIWSFPRQNSFKTYDAAGFVKCSEWLDDGEFGPNCYALIVPE